MFSCILVDGGPLRTLDKGKALVLLRTLNELLRRLSKTAQTTFCGRILTFLSGAYSLGDRSGVNLRGEYGPLWDNAQLQVGTVVSSMDVDQIETEVPKPQVANTASISPEPVATVSSKSSITESDNTAKEISERKKDEFFEIFWSLQCFFSRPPNLALPGAFDKFRTAVNVVLPVVSEANKKERLMMGSKTMIGNAGLKRKREPILEASHDSRHDYFFAKFLTSPDLLELELADSLFRRQILMQLMIALQYLQLLTKAEKPKWHPPKNRSLLTDFALEQADSAWVMETWSKTMTELRGTAPFGKEFADAATSILQRERNWIGWKNDHCPAFDKVANLPLCASNLGDFTPSKDSWPWIYGTEELTELFEMGYRNLEDLKSLPSIDDLPALVKRIKTQDKKIDMRKRQLDLQAKRRATSMTATPPSSELVSGEITASAVSMGPPGTNGSNKPPASISGLQKPPTPGVHPLPPKPGTIAPINPKPLPHPVESGRTEAQKPKKINQLAIPRDPQLESFESEKRKLSWLALRAAREDYWQLFAAAKGNPEKMMWMIERNKEVMKKWDEDSFATTGWVEGDSTVIFSEEKPKQFAIKRERENGHEGDTSAKTPTIEARASAVMEPSKISATEGVSEHVPADTPNTVDIAAVSLLPSIEVDCDNQEQKS